MPFSAKNKSQSNTERANHFLLPPFFPLTAPLRYYDNTISHRVIADFMVQLGDPTGTGRGGKSCWGEPFADEVSRALKHTGAGIVSMANSGPNTNGSQFFITLGPADWLDGKHTIFGRLTRGMRVLKRIGAVPVEQDRPKDEVKIIRAYISTGVRQQRPS